ncbi:MAG: hypothetical protein ACUVTG_15305, partial [Candidatus Oleimicrobiaceae bacterium]
KAVLSAPWSVIMRPGISLEVRREGMFFFLREHLARKRGPNGPEKSEHLVHGDHVLGPPSIAGKTRQTKGRARFPKEGSKPKLLSVPKGQGEGEAA